jgi:hypothetical protein
MVTIAQAAIVKIRGGDTPEPGSREEEVILSAWRVYRYILAKAEREGTRSIREGAPAWDWEGDVREAFHVLWPMGRKPLQMSESTWDEDRATVHTWLLAVQNLGVLDRGRAETRTRKEGVISSRNPRWWVRAQFTGTPLGMKLPDLDLEDVQRRLKSAPTEKKSSVPPSLVTSDPLEWWCPFASNCGFITPLTRIGLTAHFITFHGWKKDGGMYSMAFEDAERIRADRLDTPEPALENSSDLEGEEGEPEPEAQSILEMISRSKPNPAAPAPAVSQVPTSTGSVSAQARVFALQIAELEDDNLRLRRENQELRDKLQRAESDVVGVTRMRLSSLEVDRIAARVADRLQSKDGN